MVAKWVRFRFMIRVRFRFSVSSYNVFTVLYMPWVMAYLHCFTYITLLLSRKAVDGGTKMV